VIKYESLPSHDRLYDLVLKRVEVGPTGNLEAAADEILAQLVADERCVPHEPRLRNWLDWDVSAEVM
jgi:hypothetical protein